MMDSTVFPKDIEKFVYLNLLNGCGLNCNKNLRCFSKCEPVRHFDIVQYNKWIDFIERLEKYNIRVLYFSDEAILKFSLAREIIKKSISKVNMVRVSCDPEVISSYDIVNDLKRCGIDAIQVKLYGSTAYKHDKYKRKGSFVKLIDFMDYLNQQKIEFHVLIPLDINNTQDLVKMYNLAFDHGAHHIALERAMVPPQDLPRKDDLLPELKYILYRSKLENRIVSLTDPVLFQFNKYRIQRYITYCKLKNKVSDLPLVPCICMAGKQVLAVNFKGDVFACRFVQNCVGNIFKDDFLSLIENASEWRNTIDKLNTNKCSKCFYNQLCKGCIAYSIKYSTLEKTKDIFCTLLNS